MTLFIYSLIGISGVLQARLILPIQETWIFHLGAHRSNILPDNDQVFT